MVPPDDRISILYIEDNQANFALVRKVLESSGRLRVTGAATAEEGLELLQSHRPAILLVDLDLPGMSGIELTRRLKASSSFRDLPILAISASVMKQERDEALNAGCASFIEKPFDIGDLRSMVDEALAGTVRRDTVDPPR